MTNSNQFSNGGAVYTVNLETLKINLYSSKSKHDGKCISNHENFDINQSSSNPIPVSLEQLPAEYNGHMYFRTQDEAFIFIKTQLGM